MKKILSILLFTLLFSLVAFCFVACGENETVETFNYSLNKDGTYCLTSYNGSDGSVAIKATYNGKPVTKIGNNAFENRDKLGSIKIPDSVTSIGNYAFRGCIKLNSITFGQGVKEINIGAFYKCNSLISIEIPDSVETVGDFAFYACAKLDDVKIGDSVKTIGSYAFESCVSLNTLEIGNNVETIGYRAFYNCNDLSFVTLGEKVGKIDNRAFENCVKLASLAFPDSVKSIGEYAFAGCESLVNVFMSEKIERVGAYAFNGCNKLYDETKKNSYNIYNKGVYLGSENNKHLVLIKVEVPDEKTWEFEIHEDTQVIADAAFYNCATLNSVTLKKNLKHVGKNAFFGCTKLTVIDFNGTVEEWNGIDKADEWNKNSNISKIKCGDNDIIL